MSKKNPKAIKPSKQAVKPKKTTPKRFSKGKLIAEIEKQEKAVKLQIQSHMWSMDELQVQLDAMELYVAFMNTLKEKIKREEI